jgi:ATP-dependent DNA helicase RecG
MEKRQITNDEAEIILSYDENHFRDLKAKEIAPAKLSRAVSAFANTAGGELFVGIMEHDDGTRTWAGFGDIEAANGLVQVLEALSPMGNLYSAQFLSATGKEGLVLHLAVRKTREVISATDVSISTKGFRRLRTIPLTYLATRLPIQLRRLSLSCYRFRVRSRMLG